VIDRRVDAGAPIEHLGLAVGTPTRRVTAPLGMSRPPVEQTDSVQPEAHNDYAALSEWIAGMRCSAAKPKNSSISDEQLMNEIPSTPVSAYF
jgi:hypothetical protein